MARMADALARAGPASYTVSDEEGFVYCETPDWHAARREFRRLARGKPTLEVTLRVNGTVAMSYVPRNQVRQEVTTGKPR